MGKNYKKEVEHGFENTFRKTNDFLKHKNTVIGLTILSVLCILWYSLSNQMVALVIFALTGLITRLFVKSTGHILMISVVITFIIMTIRNNNLMEGFEGEDDENEIDGGEEDSATASNGNITELPTKPKKTKKDKKKDPENDDEDTTETFEGVDAPSSVTDTGNYAPALDTKDLLQTQEKMIANMKTIEPMMTKAHNLLRMIGGVKAGKVKPAVQASSADTTTNASA